MEPLTAVERDLVTNRWNDTAWAVPALTLPDLFTAQVARTPDAVAVTSGAASWTYAELDARSNRLARSLIGAGAGPERLVAVALPRSLEMVAVLAVVKAGAAYLPIDPGYPTDRIEFMLADAAPALLISDRATSAGLPDVAGVVVVNLDDARVGAQVEAQSGEGVTDDERIAALRLAHPGLRHLHVRLDRAAQRGGGHPRQRWPASRCRACTVAVAPGARVLQFTSLSFDASVLEL